VQIYAWQVAEIELSNFRTSGNKKHLLVAVVLATVAFEAFMNNIIEFYSPVNFKSYESTRPISERIKKGVGFLSSSIIIEKNEAWVDLQGLFRLRNSIVHNQVKSDITSDGKRIQSNPYTIEWSQATKTVVSVRQFIIELKNSLRWDDKLLEGQFKNPIKQRFEAFFEAFNSSEQIDKPVELIDLLKS